MTGTDLDTMRTAAGLTNDHDGPALPAARVTRRRRWFGWRRRGLARDDRGGVLIEFGLIAPVLFALLLGTFDIALAYFTQVGIEHSVSETARVVRVGTMDVAMTAADGGVNNDGDPANDVAMLDLVRDIFCANSPLTLNCLDEGQTDERLGICVLSSDTLSGLTTLISGNPLSGANAATFAEGSTCTNSNGGSDSSQASGSSGAAADQYVAILVRYRHTYFTPFLGLLLPNTGSLGSNQTILAYNFVYRNEPQG